MSRDWIVVNSTSQRAECLRCGVWEPLKMPALATAFVMRLKAFEEEHKDCKEGGRDDQGRAAETKPGTAPTSGGDPEA